MILSWLPRTLNKVEWDNMVTSDIHAWPNLNFSQNSLGFVWWKPNVLVTYFGFWWPRWSHVTCRQNRELGVYKNQKSFAPTSLWFQLLLDENGLSSESMFCTYWCIDANNLISCDLFWTFLFSIHLRYNEFYTVKCSRDLTSNSRCSIHSISNSNTGI